MRIKHWIFSLAVTFLLSTGLWAQSYAAPRSNNGRLEYASYQGRREHRHHHRHHHHHRRHGG